jgi:hypothetical protein
MLHLVHTGHGAETPYQLSRQRHRDAHDWAAQLTADFAHPRCPDCCGDQLLANSPANRDAVLFCVLSTEAFFD